MKINQSFDLLYLEYTENLFSSISSLCNSDYSITKGKLHVTNSSLIYEDFNLKSPLMKFIYDSNFSIKVLSKSDINNIYEEISKSNYIIKEVNDTIQLKYRRKKRSSNGRSDIRKGSIFMFSPIRNEFKTKKSSPKIELQQQLSKPLPLSLRTNSENNILKPNQRKRSTKVSQNSSNLKLIDGSKKNSKNNSNINIRFSPSVKNFSSKRISYLSYEKQILNFFNEKYTCGVVNSSVNTINDISSFDISPKRRQSPQGMHSPLGNQIPPFSLEKKNFATLPTSTLNTYFSSKGFSLSSFISLLYNANREATSTYSIIFLTYQKIRTFDRIKYTFNETEYEQPQQMMFLLHGDNDKQDIFLNDVFEFTEALSNHEQEDQDGIINIISSRKIEEIKSTLSLGNEDLYNLTANFASNDTKRNVILYANAINILPSKYQVGLFVITTEYLCEFIPVNNSIDGKPIVFEMNDIKYIVPYRFLYQYKGMNIFLFENVNNNGNKSRNILIDFNSKDDYNTVYDYLKNNCKRIDSVHNDIKYHLNLWVDGLMSNYDYIMYLNEMSGRSFNDISQYPIFPWVLSSYSSSNSKIDLNDINNYRDFSKPIGLLKSGLNKIINEDQTYIFRNYYSFPFVIFYYLMRSNPLFYIRYQGWSFGPPDRMLNSIGDCFNMTYINTCTLNDCKELIPEFYNPELNGAFLANINNIDFGKTQNGSTVGNVILPKWARSPSNFVYILRSALESEIVSNNIHQWFDIIFGYKQRGDDEIGNLFYNMRYEDCINDILNKPEEERQCFLDDILECGQVPIRLFNEPHPKKRSLFQIREIFVMPTIHHTNTKVDEIFTQKKARMSIEIKYEKERREKELQTEHIRMIYKDKEERYNQMIKELESKKNQKEIEYKANLLAVTKLNENLKLTFQEYQKNKEKIMQDVVTKLNEEYKNTIERNLSDKGELKKYLLKVEALDKKYTERRDQFNRVIKELDNKKKRFIKENTQLKEDISNRTKYIKSLPFNIQASIAGCNN